MCIDDEDPLFIGEEGQCALMRKHEDEGVQCVLVREISVY